jgi:hypothetical protein
MIQRYAAFTLMMALAACSKRSDKRAAADSIAAGESAAAPTDSVVPPASSAAPESTPPASTPDSTPDSVAMRETKSDSGRKPRLPKSAVTDTGFRAPRESLRVRPPERHPVYPPIKRPLKLPKDSDSTKRDTT